MPCYKHFLSLILNFRRVLSIVCNILGISLASDAGQIPKRLHTVLSLLSNSAHTFLAIFFSQLITATSQSIILHNYALQSFHIFLLFIPQFLYFLVTQT